MSFRQNGFSLEHSNLYLEIDCKHEAIIGMVELIIQQNLNSMEQPSAKPDASKSEREASVVAESEKTTPVEAKPDLPEVPESAKNFASSIPINCSEAIKINSIRLNDIAANVQIKDPLSPILPKGTKSVENHTLLRHTLGTALLDADSGELQVQLPATDDLNFPKQWKVCIDFELVEPTAGAYFVNDSQRKTHYCYVAPPVGMARLWMPCVDSLQDRCSWSIEVIVRASELPAVVGPGLIEQIEHPLDPENKRVWRFGLEKSSAVCASSIVLAAGSFRPTALPVPQPGTLSATEAPPVLKRVCGFSSKTLLPNVQLTCDCVCDVLECLEKLLGRPFPFPSLFICFLPDLVNPIVTGAGVILVPTHFLLQKGVIDPVFGVRQTLACALAAQYVGHFVSMRSWTDSWIVVGLSRYLGCLYVRESMGQNEFRFRLKKDIERVCAMDTQQLPLVPPSTDGTALAQSYWLHFHPYNEPTSQRAEFFRLKSALVVYMLDKRLGKGMFSSFLHQLFSSANLEECAYLLGTDQILKLARKVAVSFDTQQFTEQWLQRPGCPVFKVRYVFNRKSMQFEFFFRQSSTNAEAAQVPSFRYRGPLTFRIKEPNGVFDTEVHLEEKEQKVKVLYHSKYRKKRRHSDAENDGNDTGIANVADFEWILMDPECEWVCMKQFEQTDAMVLSYQLKHLDVGGQYDAAVAMPKVANSRCLQYLDRALWSSHYMYRVRVEAVWSMVKCANADSSHRAFVIDSLIKYVEPFLQPNTLIPRPNMWTKNLDNYFLLQTIPQALASLQTDSAEQSEQIAFLALNMLRYNDNEGNVYDDCHYVASLIKACALCLMTQTVSDALKEQIMSEIERYRARDRFLSSYGNCITLATLQAHLEWMLFGLEPVDFSLFLSYSRDGTLMSLRLLALDAVILLRGLTEPVVFLHVLSVIKGDAQPFVRYEMSRILASYTVALASSPSTMDTQLYKEIKDVAQREDIKCAFWGLANDFNLHELRIVREVLYCIESLYVGEVLPNTLRLKTPTLGPGELINADPVLDSSAAAEATARLAEQERQRFMKQAQFILQQLRNHPFITDFLYPVDETIAPNYRTIIPYPMDISTTEKKLKLNKYDSLESFIKDIRQVFLNCKIYNLEGSAIYDMASALGTFFEKDVLIQAMTLSL